MDTSRMSEGECPAVQYKMSYDEELLSVSDYAADFWEVFNKETEIVYLEKGIPREQAEGGEPLPEEIALSYRLPKSFDDVRNKEGNFTKVNEDMLVELAIRQVGIDAEQYPYKNVTIGRMK